eukprot:m.1148494 g.1148494  ORF g.1148494 m.1148494 type:complete len:110 (-) comp24475_c1_seq21:142-471(-)
MTVSFVLVADDVPFLPDKFPLDTYFLFVTDSNTDVYAQVKFLVFGHHRDLLDRAADHLAKKRIRHIRIDGDTPQGIFIFVYVIIAHPSSFDTLFAIVDGFRYQSLHVLY